MGLVNRLTNNGESLEVALNLAKQISSFPQNTMRADRISAIQSFGFNERGALEQELLRFLFCTLCLIILEEN